MLSLLNRAFLLLKTIDNSVVIVIHIVQKITVVYMCEEVGDCCLRKPDDLNRVIRAAVI